MDFTLGSDTKQKQKSKSMNEQQAIDPMDTNVNDIDTSFPVLPNGIILDLRVTKCDKTPKEDGSGETIKIELETTTTERSVKNEEIAPGFKFYRYIGITEKPERTEDGKKKRAYTAADIAKSVAQVAKPAGLNCSPKEFIANPGMLVGKILRSKIVIEKASGRYPERNGISEFITIK
jgi:hypothetical protein